MGLCPIQRRVWAKKGARPIAYHQRKYTWTYVYGFVDPENGRSYWLILPSVSLEIMKIALRSFCDSVNRRRNKIIVLLVDRAGFHKLGEEDLPEGIILYKLPPYTPELQPAESLWPLIKEVITNRSFENMEELEDVIENRCKWLGKNNEIVLGASGFR